MDSKEIAATVNRFKHSFDTKEWGEMKSCLDTTVDVDYSSFRKTPPQTIPKDEYVELRKQALQHLVTEHNYTNPTIKVKGEHAEFTCQFKIKRATKDRTKYFHSAGHYHFGLVKKQNQWFICSIKQTVTKNEGEPEIHAGVKKD